MSPHTAAIVFYDLNVNTENRQSVISNLRLHPVYTIIIFVFGVAAV